MGAEDTLPPPDNRRILRQRKGELPIPRYCVWELTLRCDQRCITCGSRGGRPRARELGTNESLKLVRELRGLGVGEITLIGGEIYLRDDFLLLIRAVREAGMACTVVTGGLNLTYEWCEAMVEAGVNSVSVSIDGMEAEHDELHGLKGCWKRAFETLDRLGRAGSKVAVNTQINDRTKGSLEELLERLSRTPVRAWQLQLTCPVGGAADRPEVLLQPHMYIDLYASLDRVADRCHELGIAIWPADNLGYFGPIEAKLRKLQTRGAHFKGCWAGTAGIGVQADGVIKGCASLGLEANGAGKWPEKSLREIWESAPEIVYFRERTRDDLWGYCAECYYAEVCLAGCTAMSESLLGRPGNNPFCYHRALEIDRMGLRERFERVEDAPGLPNDHGLYRVIREHKDPALRAENGPVAIEQPRTSRAVDPTGIGTPVVGG